MHCLINLRTRLYWLTAATAFIALAALFACTSDSTDETSTEEPVTEAVTEDLDCPDLEPLPDAGDVPLGPPPGMPYIFTGTAYVDGQLAPEGELLYVKLTSSRSKEVRVLEDGRYRDIIHGPVHPPDQDTPFVFCLGDPDGIAVISDEKVEYENKGTFHEVELDLHFSMLPSDLDAQ